MARGGSADNELLGLTAECFNPSADQPVNELQGRKEAYGRKDHTFIPYCKQRKIFKVFLNNNCIHLV